MAPRRRNDTLSGGAGDDLIYGGRGANGIDGGAGTDTAAYLGNRADYTVVAETNGSIHVTGAGAQDRLTSIEKFQFADGTLTLKDLVPVITVTASGDAAGGIPPQFDLYVNGLKVGGTTSVTASHATWPVADLHLQPAVRHHGASARSSCATSTIRPPAATATCSSTISRSTAQGWKPRPRHLCPAGHDHHHRHPGHELGRQPDLQRPVHSVIEVKPSGPVLKAPDLAEATKAGEIVSLQLENVTGKAQAAGEITFGHVFKPGDLGPGKYLVAVIDGHEVPVQLDVKATNEDGSVRHALLTIAQPSLAAGATVNLMLKTVTHARRRQGHQAGRHPGPWLRCRYQPGPQERRRHRHPSSPLTPPPNLRTPPPTAP